MSKFTDEIVDIAMSLISEMLSSRIYFKAISASCYILRLAPRKFG